MEGIGLRAEAAGSGARVLEVAAEGGDQERAEDDVGTAEPLLVPPLYQTGAPEGTTYRKTGRDSHRRNTNLKV